MPLVNISILEGSSVEFRDKLHNAIHSSLVAAFQIPESDYNQKLFEFNRNNWKIPKGKTDTFTQVEMFIFPGRKPETKKKLYQEIIRNLGNLGIPKDDILILLIEQPFENWGIRGGIPANEIDLGFSTNV